MPTGDLPREAKLEQSVPEDNKTALSEGVVQEAFKKLSWPPLKKHLDEISLDTERFDELVGHLRRRTDLIAKHPDAKREATSPIFRHLHAFSTKDMCTQIPCID
jgi:hypothetical protein